MEKFIENVQQMRRFQKEYFRYRDPISLREAKKFESLVDSGLKDLTGTAVTTEITDDHPKLF